MNRCTSLFCILIPLLCLALIGCHAESTPETTQPEPTAVSADAASVYEAAITTYSTQTQHAYQVSYQQYTQAAGQTLFEHSKQSICMQGLGTQAFTGIADETLQIGSNIIRLTERYQDGHAYFSVNQGMYTAPMTAETYISRYIPLAALDPSLYQYIELTEHNNRTLIGFAQPVAAEYWAMPDGAEFLDASAIVSLRDSTALNSIDYSICYRYGNAEIIMRVNISPLTGEAAAIPPTDIENYTSLQAIDAPLSLERACGYLLQASQLDATYSESVDCQAFGISRTRSADMSLSGTDDSFKVFLKSRVQQINHSRNGESTDLTQTELFQNGTYLVTTEEGPLKTDASVTADIMRTYCQDILVSTMPLPQHITDARMTQTDSTVILDFTCSEAFAEAICANACQTLYDDPTLLHSLATSCSIDLMTCYLEVDLFTGLPLRAGISYSAQHVIEGSAYQLSSKTNQIYSYSE